MKYSPVHNHGAAPRHGGVDFVLMMADQASPAGATQVIVSPSKTGVILQRRLAPSRERFDAADAARQGDKCETIK